MIQYLNRSVDPDIVRYAVVGMFVFLLVVVSTIIFAYARLATRVQSRALPSHVALIGSSYLIFAAVGAVDTWFAFDAPWNWKLPLRLVAFFVGLVALFIINWHLRFERATKKGIEDWRTKCVKCGSHYAADFCARCGEKQPAHNPNYR